MLNREKIEVYKLYKGDIDAWARTGRRKEKLLMETSDWYLIEELLQDIRLVNNGFASIKFSKATNERLEQSCDSQETINELKELAN